MPEQNINTCRYNNRILVEDPEPDSSNLLSPENTETNSDEDDEPAVKRMKADSGSQLRNFLDFIGWIWYPSPKYICDKISDRYCVTFNIN